MKKLLFGAAILMAGMNAIAVNPILPLWEYIPDGEPYLFDDPDNPGKKRVYLYGSHDMLVDKYCGTDLVVWSADPDSLNNWRYDGVIFKSMNDRDGNALNKDWQLDVLYAPDVTEVTLPDGSKEYYMIPNDQTGNRLSMVTKSNRPDGPFKVINWSKNDSKATEGPFGFDPAILVDDDGRVYGYWGFNKSMGAELDPTTMATVKPGTEVKNILTGRGEPGDDRFFEASSMRKIGDKYVLIYSRWTDKGEFGLYDSNYTLAYAYSDNPLGPFTYGGTIIDGRGRDTDADGNTIVTAVPFGNTHGSILNINDRWWVFYHRQTGTDEFSRQAMVAPIEVNVEPGKGGKVTISEAEYTSEGFETDGLDPMKKYPAGIASHLTGPTAPRHAYPKVYYTGSYVEPKRIADHRVSTPYDLSINFNPVVNNTNGSTVGYKYFNFDKLQDKKKVELALDIIPTGVGGTIDVYTEKPWKEEAKPVGKFIIDGEGANIPVTISADISKVKKLKGKHPLYLVFNSPTEGKSICTLNFIEFK